MPFQYEVNQSPYGLDPKKMWENRFDAKNLNPGLNYGEVMNFFKERERSKRLALRTGIEKYKELGKYNENEVKELQSDFIHLTSSDEYFALRDDKKAQLDSFKLSPKSDEIVLQLVQCKLDTLKSKMAKKDQDTSEVEDIQTQITCLEEFAKADYPNRQYYMKFDATSTVWIGIEMGSTVQTLIDQFINNYYAPTHQWMPDTPITVYEDGIKSHLVDPFHIDDVTNHQPLQLIRDLNNAIDTSIYPKEGQKKTKLLALHPSDDPHYGEDDDRIKGVLFNLGSSNLSLIQGKAEFDDNGLIKYPLSKTDKGKIFMPNYYGRYIEYMANGEIKGKYDETIVANFGTILLHRAQFAKKPEKEKAQEYYQTASEAFSVARKIALKNLTGTELTKFNESLLLQEGDALLRTSLANLYNRDEKVIPQTEANLQSALIKLQDYLSKNPKDEYAMTLRDYSVYHLGVFYQDILREPTKAIEYYKTFLELKSKSLDALEDNVLQRKQKAEKVIEFVTQEGEHKKINLLEHISKLPLLEYDIEEAVLNHYKKDGLTYINVPQMVGLTGACENTDTLYKIENNQGLTLYFTQTGQLGLEQALQVFKEGTVTIIVSGRMEDKKDERHLQQFQLIEEEFGCKKAGMEVENYNENNMFEALLQRIEKATQTMIKVAVDKHGDTLSKTYGRNVKDLQAAIDNPYLRINYEDAIKLLNENGFKELKFGDDLKANHEQVIVKLWNENNRKNNLSAPPTSDLPVFICKYPKEIKFFNMKVSTDDSRVVLSADLILPFAGESAGASVREHDSKKLFDRLLSSTMFANHLKRGGTLADFQWYLDIIDENNPDRPDPHAGYGIGKARVMQYLLGLTDIRNCITTEATVRQTSDWDAPKAIAIPTKP